MTDNALSGAGVVVCSASELEKQGRVVAVVDGVEIVVSWNDGNPGALTNACVHRGRKLAEGFFLKGRLVCPGHQWSFDAVTGYCKEREKYQPAHRVEVVDDKVTVHVTVDAHAQ
ncbi:MULTISPECIES: Rieske (2Fe-2S) protein [unclassified Mycolicibacterium]|uniref:Rieske (2Fe-2S) protein n=1 Tax=unclassified Mycolicibacterium TaxID=2636767 RepID=UPI001F4C1D65|nr:Rieske (2Fe-2S) protein [Mycolicibacterium sp. YH-1]UNB52193.1 Rieske (2Fe-2S) protein [Mycolicibacterium sp. YH-1]